MDPCCYLPLERAPMLGPASAAQALRQADCLRFFAVLYHPPNLLGRVLVRCLRSQLLLQRCVPACVQDPGAAVHLVDSWGSCVDLGVELAPG